MDETIPHIIMSYQNDARQREEKYILRQILDNIYDSLSKLQIDNGPYSAEMMPTLFDPFLSVVLSEEEEIDWNKFGFELGNLALRILAAVERMGNFQSYFAKLLPAISVICRQSLGSWRRVANPLLKVFTSKKLDFVYLKRSIKEFKSISKCAESSEIAKFTQQNLSLLQEFYRQVFHIGDILLQMDILEIVLTYAAGDKSLIQSVLAGGRRSTRQLLETLNFFDFEKDSRIFLNALNASLAEQRRVFSINCNLVYFGNLSLSPPLGMEGIWIDVNRDSRRMTISCNDCLTNSDVGRCIILQLPLSQIEKLKLEFGVLSGSECYCITMDVSSLTEMYEFAKGRAVVCTASSERNPRTAVTDFVKVVEELSVQIRERSQREKKVPSDIRAKKAAGYDVTPSHAEQRRASCTSPAVFTTGSIDRHGGKGERKWNQMSQSSPLTLLTCSREKDKAQNKKERDEVNVTSTSVLKNIHFELHQFSSSAVEVQPLYRFNGVGTDNGSDGSLGRDKLANQSKVNVEKHSLQEHNFSRAEERRKENGREVRQWRHCTSFARICEDYILTQEFEVSEGGNSAIGKAKGDPPASGSTRGRRRMNQEKVRKGGSSAKGKRSAAEEGWKTSLLDPNGYAYRRWMRPTTSDRSNFWLNKLKDPQKTATKPKEDIFLFDENGDLSDDSNVFKKVAKKRKLRPALRSGWTAQFTRSVLQGTRRSRTAQKEKSSELTRSGCNSETRANFRDRTEEPETTVNSKNRVRMDIDKTYIQSPVHFYVESGQSMLPKALSGRPRKQETRVEGEKQTGKEGTPGVKRKIWSGEGSSAPPRAVQNKAVKTDCLEELDDVARRLSSGFDKLLQETGELEAICARRYAEETKARMKSFAEVEEQEMADRPRRFELCLQYFFRGCSTLDSNGDTQQIMEKVTETMEKLNCEEGYWKEKVTGFAGKLKEMVAQDAEAAFNRRMKNAHVQRLQDLLSYHRRNCLLPQRDNLF